MLSLSLLIYLQHSQPHVPQLGVIPVMGASLLSGIASALSQRSLQVSGKKKKKKKRGGGGGGKRKKKKKKKKKKKGGGGGGGGKKEGCETIKRMGEKGLRKQGKGSRRKKKK